MAGMPYQSPVRHIISTPYQYSVSPPVRLPSLTFHVDCGSIKGAGVPAEVGTSMRQI